MAAGVIAATEPFTATADAQGSEFPLGDVLAPAAPESRLGP